MTLALNKPAYAGMYILESSKVPMYKLDCDYINKNMGTNWIYYSQILTAYCIKLKLEMLMTISIGIKKYLIFVIISLSQNVTLVQTH